MITKYYSQDKWRYRSEAHTLASGEVSPGGFSLLFPEDLGRCSEYRDLEEIRVGKLRRGSRKLQVLVRD